MILARVTGSVVATIKHGFYTGKRLLMLETLDEHRRATGYLVAIDTVGAGDGETVLVVDEGNSARQIVDDPTAPLRSVIVGIVDEVAISTSKG